MKRSKFHIIFLLLSLPAWLQAQVNFNGGPGLTYVRSAWTIGAGRVSMSGYARAFGQAGDFPKFGTVTVWDVSGRMIFNYGYKDFLELSFSPTVYQQTNKGGDAVNAPHDLQLGLKVGSINSPGSFYTLGFQIDLRIPTGTVHNIPFEPYMSERVGWGAMALFTFAKDPLYPQDDTNVHVNLGYWNHNDRNVQISPGSPAAGRSQELLYGAGIKFPTQHFHFSLELYGSFFLQRPPPAAYSRENYAYFTPTIGYKPIRWFTFYSGFDIRVFNARNTTDYSLAPRVLPKSQPNYGGWRIFLGSKFNLLPMTNWTTERELLMDRAQQRRDLFEEILNEQQETETLEAELARIIEEREKSGTEIRGLQRLLQYGDGLDHQDVQVILESEPDQAEIYLIPMEDYENQESTGLTPDNLTAYRVVDFIEGGPNTPASFLADERTYVLILKHGDQTKQKTISLTAPQQYIKIDFDE